MVGNHVAISPVGMMMIHNPATVSIGDEREMKKAIEMLSEVKESIINAYELRTGLSRAKLSHLMENETWMNANKAVELGFATAVAEYAVMLLTSMSTSNSTLGTGSSLAVVVTTFLTTSSVAPYIKAITQYSVCSSRLFTLIICSPLYMVNVWR